MQFRGVTKKMRNPQLRHGSITGLGKTGIISIVGDKFRNNKTD